VTASPLPLLWRRLRGALATIGLVGLLAGCGKPAGDAAPAPTDPAAFRILAGSELKDLEPALLAAGRRAGVPIAIAYAGTLDIVERINAGETFDAILPPNGAYPALALMTKPVAREKLAYSRVALGVKAGKLAELGWDRTAPTWADIARAAGTGKLRYAMTNPASSNTGMSALFAVASAIAGKTEDLDVGEVDGAVLKSFLAGQKVTAGSSGWLTEAYTRDAATLDAMVNYEAVILRLDDQLPPADRLTLVYPTDGVISADYPLMLLAPARRADYDTLVAALKAPDFQRDAIAAAYLRPANSDVPAAPALPATAVAELAFPNRLDVIDAVLSAYQDEWRRPSTSIFVLDTSGSMEGERMEQMREALKILAGAQPTSASARYASFQNRERVVLIPFSSTVGTPQRIEFHRAGAEAARADVRGAADRLRADGGTAIYSALDRAQAIAAEERQSDPDRFVSIVLLTDGKNNEGRSFEAFRRDAARGAPARVFPILFGEGDTEQMKQVAALTGGRVFDGRKAALAAVFKEIRGYQ
jgi:Ca-activated chloride channel family protein